LKHSSRKLCYVVKQCNIELNYKIVHMVVLKISFFRFAKLYESLISKNSTFTKDKVIIFLPLHPIPDHCVTLQVSLQVRPKWLMRTSGGTTQTVLLDTKIFQVQFLFLTEKYTDSTWFRWTKLDSTRRSIEPLKTIFLNFRSHISIEQLGMLLILISF
jgi:hypothetical protein